MPVTFDKTMYPKVKQWLIDNPQDESLSEPIKKSLLRFETLTEPEKEQLQVELLAIGDLPEVLQRFMPDRLGAQPVELLGEVCKYLTHEDIGKLARANRNMHSLFHQSNLHVKFLECVAYGQQDKAEKLLSQVFHGKPERIQAALLHRGTFTTYAGETFNCSAYAYAYWAKDTHMCRMLERYMDDETKAQMLTRIDAIEADGLTFQQNDEEHRSTQFDFTTLKEAYQRYLSGYDAWLAARDWEVMYAAWLDVGKAQRNVPAHVAQEYCRPDRTLSPTPEFNEATLPRVLTFWNYTTDRYDSWFPLAAPNSGLGFDFALVRHVMAGGPFGIDGVALVRAFGDGDLAAVIRLDEVRTVDLTQLREQLNPPATFYSKND